MVLVFSGFVSCEDMLEPIDENRLTPEYVGSDPASAEGLLMQAYNGLIDPYSFTEAATDDAVNNQPNSGYKLMARGELSARFNPASRWNKYEEVFYINKFIDVVNSGDVQWKDDEEINALFAERLKGEALALRGLYQFYVLQAHAGVGANGELLGVPYFTEFIDSNEDFNVPRLSFEETVKAINDDFEAALNMLPFDYSDDEADQPERYSDIDFNQYQVVNGAQYDLRISGRIVKALQARLALFAASPSFLDGSGYYEEAANISSELLNMIGGVNGLVEEGNEFYDEESDKDSGEFLWRSSIGGNDAWLEENHFPPSRNGDGNVNPSQNLVDAFPMDNGFPATEENGYDPQNPYENRDPRLKMYIVVDGSSIGGGEINTGFGGGVDRLDSITGQSTTTGYYLKKLLRPDVRINDDGTVVGKRHITPYFRYTELFLILAEAANEIGGPDHAVGGISARDVLAAIRERAGIEQPDAYLASISSQDQMRELIRNERRIELSFEGFRFYDIRRWGMPLNENVDGYYNNGSEYVLVNDVERRNFPQHATYLPIPYNEVLKFSELVQNEGW